MVGRAGPMLIFISGGTGFIGSHSVSRLLEVGHKVRLLTVTGPGLAKNLPQQNIEIGRAHV